MLKKYFRKADFILLAMLILIGIAGSVLLSFGDSGGDRVVITVRGEDYGTYPLSEDRTIEVTRDGRSNTVVIEDGTVRVTDATCKNHVCIDHAPIRSAGESIICLPNRVVVKIEGKGGDLDAISS